MKKAFRNDFFVSLDDNLILFCFNCHETRFTKENQSK